MVVCAAGQIACLVTSDLLIELRTHAIHRASQTAMLATDGSSITFGDLWLRIERVAAGFARAGIGRNDIVAAVVNDGMEMLCSFLGVLRVAAFAPLNPALGEEELQTVFEGLRPAAILSDTAPDSPIRLSAQHWGIPVWSPSRDTDAAGPRLPEASAEDRALLLHTSATTGTAKLIAHTHGSLRRMAADSTKALQLTQSDRLLNMMPLFHLQGLLSCLEQLMAGGSVVTASGFDAQRFSGWMRMFKPSWYTAGPALHSSVLNVIDSSDERIPFPGLRFVRSIGAPLSGALFQEIEEKLRVPVIEGYGLTEIGPVTSNPLPPGKRKVGSVGRSVGPELKIWDESGNAMKTGEAGEIVVRCPQKSGEWIRTGDLGYLDAESYLYVSGRIKDVINSGGTKILPAEIDERLAKHPAVEDAAAFGIWHATMGEQVVAAVALKPGKQVSEAELRRFAFKSLARFKVPRRIIFLDAIPKTPTGKPQRQILTEQWRPEPMSGNGDPSVRTALDEDLLGIWETVLKKPIASVDDDLLSIGADSLHELELLTAVEERYGSIPDLEEFFLQPTVATLARMLGGSPHDGRPAVVTLQPEGQGPALFCIPGAHEGPYSLTMLANSMGRERPFHVLRDPVPAVKRGGDSIEESAARILSALRSVQPDGPYLLCGHCYGGIVAFELACQITRLGEPVDLLALIDTPTPGYPKPLQHWRRYMREALLLIARRHIRWDEIREHVAFLSRSRKREIIPRTASRMNATMAVNEAAARRYRPRPYAGRVSVFLAMDEHHEHRILDDVRLGWRDVARGGFAEYRVPGAHDSVLLRPHVETLASEIKRELRRDGGSNTRIYQG